jgi:hypothetical protein
VPDCVYGIQYLTAGALLIKETRMMPVRQLKNEDDDSIVEAESAAMSKTAL